MKTKLIVLWCFVLGALSIKAQETIIEKDTIYTIEAPKSNDDEVEEDYESSDEGEDTVYTAHLYSIDSSNYPYLPITNLNDTLSKLKQNKDYWYVNAVFKDKTKKAANDDNNNNNGFINFLTSNTFKIIVWVLLIGLALTVLFIFLNENNIHFFKRKSKNLYQKSQEEVKDENIFETNFDIAIKNAVQQQNYTLATRLHYLQLLVLLHSKNKIIYSKEKTNLDYLFNLSGTSYYNDFATATRNYEFVWYGEFEISDIQFNKIEAVFNNLKNQIQ